MQNVSPFSTKGTSHTPFIEWNAVREMYILGSSHFIRPPTSPIPFNRQFSYLAIIEPAETYAGRELEARSPSQE